MGSGIFVCLTKWQRCCILTPTRGLSRGGHSINTVYKEDSVCWNIPTPPAHLSTCLDSPLCCPTPGQVNLAPSISHQ